MIRHARMFLRCLLFVAVFTLGLLATQDPVAPAVNAPTTARYERAPLPQPQSLTAAADTTGATVYGWHWAETVDVYDGTPATSNWQVAEAVREWDRASTGLRMRLVTDPAVANIAVYEVADTCGVACAYVETLPVTNGVATGTCRVELETRVATRPVAEELALHEIGHCLGLDHAPMGTRSVMAPQVSEDDFYTQPQRYDKANIQTLYP